jgi:hypothetical protein
MDPVLAGFLGGLIPGAVAIGVAVYEVRSVKRQSIGTMYANYASAVEQFASLIRGPAELMAVRDKIVKEVEEAKSRFHMLPESSPVSNQVTQETELTRLEDLDKQANDLLGEAQEAMGKADDLGASLGVIRHSMTVFASKEFSDLRQRIDAQLTCLTSKVRDLEAFEREHDILMGMLCDFLEEANKRNG